MQSNFTLSFIRSSMNLYISKQFLLCLGIVVLVLFSVICFFECIEKIRTSIGHADVSLGFFVSVTLLRLPQYLLDFMPFIFFLANLLNFWKLNHNNEIIALRATGVSGAQLAFGNFLTCVFIGVLSLLIFNPLAASCNTRYNILEEKVLKKNHQQLSIASTGFWLREVKGNKKNIFHAKEFELKNKVFYTVTIYEFNVDNQFVKRIDAKKAELIDQNWRLLDVVEWVNNTQTFHSVMDIPTELTFQKIQNSAISPKHIPFWQIPACMDQLEKNGMSTLGYSVYWHRLWAEIFLLGVMSVLAVGFCLQNARYHKVSKLITAALISGFFIHFLSKIIYAYGEAERLAPVLSAWLPPLIVGFLGIAYLMHVDEKT